MPLLPHRGRRVEEQSAALVALLRSAAPLLGLLALLAVLPASEIGTSQAADVGVRVVSMSTFRRRGDSLKRGSRENEKDICRERERETDFRQRRMLRTTDTRGELHGPWSVCGPLTD